ncbi:hypothetical protein BESB_009380 [Besnoitia besnoiti]|uniref:Uncharacterized protein n=1 Tax=Besnoitia besnoiti TaxID=94643 RepID=A0A2A9MQ53_BESBE|nr:hypothetical protein BESB_009380 [Besnoitia besnoiti]PFH38596.1 hypothetical protein BESB_009380 [Besnoitia besnoiti]
MALFRGCSHVIDESLDEFLVKHDPDYAAGRTAGDAAESRSYQWADGDRQKAGGEFFGASVESALQESGDSDDRIHSPKHSYSLPVSVGVKQLPTADDGAVKIDTQKLGRALSVAVTGLGEQVKQGGELLWRSAVTAAGQVIVHHGMNARGSAAGSLRSFSASSPSAAALLSSSLSSSTLASAVSSASCFNVPLAAAGAKGLALMGLDAAGGQTSLGAWMAAPSFEADVWGDERFALTLREERQKGDFTGLLVAEAKLKAETGSLSAGAAYRWQRRFPNGVLMDVADVSGNTYHISADDIGCKIQVTCSVSRLGEMYASLGPFQVDSRTRSCVLNSLAKGGSRFPCCAALEDACDASVSNPGSPAARLAAGFGESPRGHALYLQGRRGDASGAEEGKEFFVYVGPEEVVVTQRGGVGALNDSDDFDAGGMGLLDRRWSARFSSEYPRLLLHPADSKRFTLALSEEKAFVLNAYTRHQRDLIAMTLRSFHARAAIGASKLLDLVHTVAGGGKTVAADEIVSELEDKRIDLYVMVHSLSSELRNAVAGRLRAVRDCDRVSKEKEALEEEMTSTIQAFQEQLADLASEQTPPSRACPAPGAASVSTKNATLIQINDDLQVARAQIRAYTQEIEKLQLEKNEMAMRFEAERHTFQEILRKRLETLMEENRQLQAANEQLGARLVRQSSSQLESSAGAASGAESREAPERLQAELRRLRKEVEAAHLDKHQLGHELEELKSTLSRERQEKEAAMASVQDALVHLKARYDCLLEEMQALRVSRDTAEEGVSQRLKVYEDMLLTREKQCEEHTKQLESSQHDVAELQAERNRLKKVLASITKDLEKSRAALDASTSREQSLTAEKRQVELRLSEVVQRQQRQEELNSREAQLKQQESLMRAQDAQKRADELTKQLAETRQALLQEQQTRHGQQLRAEQVAQQLAAVQARMHEQEAHANHLKAEVERLQTSNDARNAAAAEGASASDESGLRAKVTELTDVVARQEEEMKRLKDESSTLKTRLIKLTKSTA